MNKTNINKTFKTSFHIDKSKAVRINDVIESNYAKIKDGTLVCSVKVLLSNEKELEFNEFNQIFNLDNGRKNRIVSVKITYEKNKNLVELSYSNRPNIYLEVSGKEMDWSNEMFAEVEEQIERTKVYSLIGKYKSNPSLFRLFLMLIVTLLTLIATTYVDSQNGNSRKLNLDNDDVQYLRELNKEISSNDDKINFVYETQIRILNINQEAQDSFDASKYLTDWNFYAVIIPIILILFGIWYTLTKCYPSSVFDWADMKDDYQKILDRRKLLWNLIIGSLVIGILANLFVFGLTSFTNK